MRSASGLATPPGSTSASYASASALSTVSSTGNVSALSRWLKACTSPASVLTSRGVPPASCTAFHGSVSSTCSMPSGATRKATVLPAGGHGLLMGPPGVSGSAARPLPAAGLRTPECLQQQRQGRRGAVPPATPREYPMADVSVAVIYYSATGSVHALARAAAEGAEKAGAEVRLRKVHELAPQEAIESNEGWSKHALETAGRARGHPRRPRVGRRRPARHADPLRPAHRAAQAVHRHDRPALGRRQARQQGRVVASPPPAPPTAARSRRSWRSTTPSTTGARSSCRPATPTRSSSRPATRTAPRTCPPTARTRPARSSSPRIAFQATRATEIARALKVGLAAA